MTRSLPTLGNWWQRKGAVAVIKTSARMVGSRGFGTDLQEELEKLREMCEKKPRAL